LYPERHGKEACQKQVADEPKPTAAHRCSVSRVALCVAIPWQDQQMRVFAPIGSLLHPL
ncbi:unnamed protein product, partial [marine sediment metagenome]